MKKVIYVFMLAVLTGCMPPKYLPPTQSNIQNEKIYDAPYDKLWAASVKIFADRTWEIKTIEKVSGIIAGESMYNFGTSMDCGSIIHPATGGKEEKIEKLDNAILKYNFYVKNISENQSSLKINLKGIGQGIISYIKDPFSPPIQETRHYNCISTGKLEQSLFKAIENNLSSK